MISTFRSNNDTSEVLTGTRTTSADDNHFSSDIDINNPSHEAYHVMVSRLTCVGTTTTLSSAHQEHTSAAETVSTDGQSQCTTSVALRSTCVKTTITLSSAEKERTPAAISTDDQTKCTIS